MYYAASRVVKNDRHISQFTGSVISCTKQAVRKSAECQFYLGWLTGHNYE